MLLFRETIFVYFEIHTMCLNSLAIKQNFFNVTVGGTYGYHCVSEIKKSR
jgi:hypothetical protein